MEQPISAVERRQAILQLLDRAGRVEVSGLSQDLSVSEVTIRTDLQALADAGLLVRTHGGAVRTGNGLQELSLALRTHQQVQEKAHIAAAAARLVADGDAVALDASSTALAIARLLKSRRYLTVITNGLATAQELLDAPHVRVVLTGGVLRHEAASLVAPGGLDFLTRYHIQIGFFGAHGVNVPEGLTDNSTEESEVKRALLARCRQVVAVLDATKWGRVGLSVFAVPHEISQIITDAHAPADLVAQVRNSGIVVTLV
jgi:DeoR family transcriptional regulator of aga operon/DeoR family fructose operon transcriptional repressor